VIDSIELNKRRTIIFCSEPSGQLARAYELLSGLPECMVAYSESPNTLLVSYNLRHYTLNGLEEGLTQEGFHLDQSPLHRIGRQVIYYCEDTVCHNLDIPTHTTKDYEREVFVQAYERYPHGDHDDTPVELRDYK
jgi:hypothetical protein